MYILLFPFILISRTLCKVQQGARVTIIAPLWRNQVWFPEMMKMLVDFPVLLLKRKDVLMHPMTREEPSMKIRLMACNISGVTSEVLGFQKKLEAYCAHHGDHQPQRLTNPSLKDGFHFVLEGNVIPWYLM